MVDLCAPIRVCLWRISVCPHLRLPVLCLTWFPNAVFLNLPNSVTL